MHRIDNANKRITNTEEFFRALPAVALAEEGPNNGATITFRCVAHLYVQFITEPSELAEGLAPAYNCDSIQQLFEAIEKTSTGKTLPFPSKKATEVG